MSAEPGRPAFYALAGGGWRDWWTLLHAPYTAWHLAYVVIGAALAPEFAAGRLALLLPAFFLAVGVAAHALDEAHGRPLGTRIPGSVLRGAATVSLLGALALGGLGAAWWQPWLAVFIVVGGSLVCAYNLELAGGRFHTDAWFALGWGAFPLLTAYFATAEKLRVEAIVGALAAAALSHAQRRMSTQARNVRRQVVGVSGSFDLRGGAREPITREALLAPAEAALGAMTLGVCALALALVLMRVS